MRIFADELAMMCSDFLRYGGRAKVPPWPVFWAAVLLKQYSALTQCATQKSQV
jgi:hypothetical protein